MKCFILIALLLMVPTLCYGQTSTGRGNVNDAYRDILIEDTLHQQRQFQRQEQVDSWTDHSDTDCDGYDGRSDRIIIYDYEDRLDRIENEIDDLGDDYEY